MKSVHFLLACVLLALASSLASAYDPNPLQDFCVAINNTETGIFVNGKLCKDPTLATVDDFTYRRFNIPGDTNNQLGRNATRLSVDTFPGVNTLGIILARIDYEPGGVNPPHFHPRASEILHVQDGTLYVGFADSNYTLFSTILYPGDLFAIPLGMVHFQVNIGKTDAVAFASFGSQDPGLVNVANAVFGTNPPIKPEPLARAFMLDVNVVKDLQEKFLSSDLAKKHVAACSTY
ncbi:hypothetical protein EZV62_007468 [Acer yangbiense]|uniref:Germin-like protein n=1 Tax=Acer yangbiense TaxID=1000413 RepID=A0A5C7I9G6_9ROSI|nr:hypothetical protein EZV62_007468 [Acer yangbiense]